MKNIINTALAFVTVLILASASSAFAQGAQPDWVLGQWNEIQHPPAGYPYSPPPSTVNFIKNGNEIRAVTGSGSNLVRAVTDDFGVTTWQTWIGPYPQCPGGPQPGEWVPANIQIASDHRSITIYIPSRDMGNADCGVGSQTSEVDLTR